MIEDAGGTFLITHLVRQTITTPLTTPTTPVDVPDTTVVQGPVGQPLPTVSGVPTVYHYTTTDANGQTTVIRDTFTPSFPPSTNPPPPTASGTILPYSSWLSIIGTNTIPPSNAALPAWQLPGATLGIAASLAAILTGALITIAI